MRADFFLEAGDVILIASDHYEKLGKTGDGLGRA